MKKSKVNLPEKKDFLAHIMESKYSDLVLVVLIFLVITIPFYRMSFIKYEPPAHDVIQWRTSAHVQLAYTEENKVQSLWNTNLFSGMPGFMITYDGSVPHLGTLLRDWLGSVVHWSFVYLFFAALGMYILMLSLGADKLVAALVGLSFGLSCHFIGLIEIGHNTKLRAITYIPWIIWGIRAIFSHKSIIAVAGSALFIFSQLRENHVQISYYTFIMIFLYLLYELIWHWKDYRLKEYFFSIFLFILSLVLAFITVAQPYLPVREYTEYTIRGGTQGLDFDYATSWSFHPLEILSFIVPHFFGGVSPTYWGWMPFTQTSNYMGIIIFMLALFSLFKVKVRFVWTLLTVVIVALLFSFGRHFRPFTEILLSYLPLYNKFRVPAMILVLVQFAIPIMAGLGLMRILELVGQKKSQIRKFIKYGVIVSLAGIVLALALSSIIGETDFVRPAEQTRLSPQQLDHLSNQRSDLLIQDTLKAFIILLLFFCLTFLFSREKLKKHVYVLLLLVLVCTDLLIVNSNFLKNLTKRDDILTPYLEKTEADRFLADDNELFRVFPLAGEFGQSRWSVHNQSIGGYSGAKLRRYQNILDFCIHAELQHRVPINWNVVNMLNVKYIIFQDRLPFENLSYAFYDRENRMVVHKNESYLPRAWFVKDSEEIPDEERLFRRLNSPSFDPSTIALLEYEVERFHYPEEKSINIKSYDLHRIELEVNTDVQSFLVLSEIYYPAGWKAFLNGEEIPIHPVNHILRGLELPAGSHNIELVFRPQLHYISGKISFSGFMVLTILLIIGLVLYIKKNYRGEIEYVIK